MERVHVVKVHSIAAACCVIDELVAHLQVRQAHMHQAGMHVHAKIVCSEPWLSGRQWRVPMPSTNMSWWSSTL